MKYVDKIEQAKQFIIEACNNYKNIAVACSFGKDSMVVLHMARSVVPDIKIFSVMTPFKFRETLQYKECMTDLWKLDIITYIETSIREDLLFYSNPDACCKIYKVEMTKKAIKEMKLDAWITGLRRTEGRTRIDYDFVEYKYGLVKINPILDFTELDVWRYLAVNNIPVNPLYGLGYRSLGCEPCSTKETDESDLERDGRWKGTSKCGGECGIHTQVLK